VLRGLCCERNRTLEPKLICDKCKGNNDGNHSSHPKLRYLQIFIILIVFIAIFKYQLGKIRSEV
jgi:hypothetical protein